MNSSTKFRTAVCVAAISALATPAVPLAGAQDMRMPDTRDVAQGYTPLTQDLRSPDTVDVAQGRDLTPSLSAAPATSSVPSDGGLDWVSAALGAAIFGGLVIVAAAAAALLGRARTRVVT